VIKASVRLGARPPDLTFLTLRVVRYGFWSLELVEAARTCYDVTLRRDVPGKALDWTGHLVDL
jgi:hypothetical protein